MEKNGVIYMANAQRMIIPIIKICPKTRLSGI